LIGACLIEEDVKSWVQSVPHGIDELHKADTG
jgi:hypothetical protein